MFSISDFSVYIDSTDIGAMVTSMSLYESVHGNLKGTLFVEDKVNFFDTFFRGPTMTPIQIGYNYFELPLEITLYVDGVTNQVITKMGKSYNINITSINNLNESATRICNAYSGTSNDIIKNLWLETHGEDTILILDSDTASKGKYIVPNIPAAIAMSNVVNASYDKNYTGMFLYQRLADQGMTRFTSLYDMVNDQFMPDGRTPFLIHSEEVTLDSATSVAATVGSASSFTLTDYNKDFIRKLSGGMWGQKITEIALDETTDKVLPEKEITDVEVIKMSLSKNLFETEVSLFTPESLVQEEIIRNMKYRLFNTNLNVSEAVAVPGLGCGMVIEVLQGGSNISRTKTDGSYLVANINHTFIMDDGEMKYSQNMGLVREGST